MKHLHKFEDYKIISPILERLNNIKSLIELNDIEMDIQDIQMNEGLYKFVKSKVQKVKDFFADAGKTMDYLLVGDDQEEEEDYKEPEYDEEILMVYNEPYGADEKDTYIVHNGRNITNVKTKFSKIFYPYKFKHNTEGNLKDSPAVRISKYNNRQTGFRNQYVISLYALLDELEVDRELYGHGDIEEVTPSVFIYLKDIKIEGFEKRLRQYYKKLLKLPKFYDKKTFTNFKEKIIIDALETIYYDYERSH